MSRPVLYMAHPLGAPEAAGVRANLERAMRWLAWLRRTFPETTFIAPWIATVLAGADEHDPVQREAGLVDDCAVVERCDGIVLCGGRESSGMTREATRARRAWDLTGLGDEPPTFSVGRLPFSYWARAFERRS